MAHSIISLEQNGITKAAPIGFSWTTLFFGPIPALLRGHILMGAILLALAIITAGISSIIAAFIYNKMYVTYLIEKGYRFKDVQRGKSKEDIQQLLGIELTSR